MNAVQIGRGSADKPAALQYVEAQRPTISTAHAASAGDGPSPKPPASLPALDSLPDIDLVALDPGASSHAEASGKAEGHEPAAGRSAKDYEQPARAGKGLQEAADGGASLSLRALEALELEKLQRKPSELQASLGHLITAELAQDPPAEPSGARPLSARVQAAGLIHWEGSSKAKLPGDPGSELMAMELKAERDRNTWYKLGKIPPILATADPISALLSSYRPKLGRSRMGGAGAKLSERQAAADFVSAHAPAAASATAPSSRPDTAGMADCSLIHQAPDVCTDEGKDVRAASGSLAGEDLLKEIADQSSLAARCHEEATAALNRRESVDKESEEASDRTILEDNCLRYAIEDAEFLRLAKLGQEAQARAAAAILLKEEQDAAKALQVKQEAKRRKQARRRAKHTPEPQLSNLSFYKTASTAAQHTEPCSSQHSADLEQKHAHISGESIQRQELPSWPGKDI